MRLSAYTRHTASAVLFLSLLLPARSGSARSLVRIQPHAYLGAGFGFATGVTNQPFIVENADDANYVMLNQNNPHFFWRFQTRLTLLELDRFSIGYAFWSHCRKYATQFSEVWARPGKQYPFSDDLNLHAVTLQWDLTYPWISSRYVWPYLVFGKGRFQGTSKSFTFDFLDDFWYQLYSRNTRADQQHDGSAWMIGGGFVFFRRLYIYIGKMDFQSTSAPMQGTVDCILGLRI